MPDISADEIADELRKSGIIGYEVALARKDQRIAELEAALRKIADMQTEGEPVRYSWGLEYFQRAHRIAVDALRHDTE